MEPYTYREFLVEAVVKYHTYRATLQSPWHVIRDQDLLKLHRKIDAYLRSL